MATVNTYLTFKGNCEEAFNFYKTAFGGEFAHLGRFKDMPQDKPDFKIDETELNKIMHISYPIGNTMLMGSDTGGEWAKKVTIGNNFSVSVNTNSQEEADRIYNLLSEGGTIIMPMDKTFWGSYFGMFTDKYGVQWMVSYDVNH